MAACAEQHYAIGECFVMRGIGSQGRVVDVPDISYVIELPSSDGPHQWKVSQTQLDVDTRPCEYPSVVTKALE